MKILFQIFTGDLTERSLADPESILRKLSMAREKDQLAGVLCGWTTDRSFYEPILERLHSWQVPVYLKTAVFSELKPYGRFDPLIDYTGSAAEPYVLNPQESFEFRCPASAHNRQVPLDIYSQYFSDLPFDGIFLDRVRYPSALSGVAGMGGCFCPDCQKRYAQAGLDIEKLRARLQRWQAGEAPELMAYEEGRWLLADPLLDGLFRVKAEILTEALTGLIQWFHERGLQVGLDLFAPALGYFCGQDAQSLRQAADFVKPMMYRYTEAPAGLPFEIQQLKRVMKGAKGPSFEELAGGGRHQEELVCRELTWLKKAPGCAVWPGMEANYIEPIIQMRPHQIRENRQLLESLGYEQMVASWNLFKIPEENMQALLD